MKHFLSFFLLIYTTLLFIGCGDNQNQQTNVEVKKPDATSLYGEAEITFPSLSEQARNFTSQWGAFEDFETESKAINGATIEDLKNSSERLMTLTDSISKNLPDTIAVQPIKSRVMVAQTRAHLLNQMVHRTQIDSVKLQDYIVEMNNATSNLIVQLNDKFKKDAIDQERIETEKKEIEAQKRRRDSIFKEELKDKNS